MDISIGSLYNSAANLVPSVMDAFGFGVSDEENQKRASLKGFLQTMTQFGTQVKSNFEADYHGLAGLKFYIQSINIPGLKTNNGSIYYKTREIQLPVTYEQEHDFQMTILNDGNGFIYTQIRNILMNDYANRRPYSNATMDITAHGDNVNYGGMKINMNGVRFKTIGGIDFNYSDNTLQTFTVDCTAVEVNFVYMEIEKTKGAMDYVDQIGSTINNVLGG